MSPSPRNIAYVYSDTGVGPKSLKALMAMLKTHLKDVQVKTIDAKQVTNSSWEQDALLIAFPGGRDIPYHEKLSGKGCEKIRSFVEQGGLYLGICAGAYFGCSSFTFEPDSPLEVIGERELGFYPGDAFGPALGIGKFCYKSEEGAEAALIGSKEKQTHIYYNGGCAFPHLYPHVEILASYASLEKNPAAIVLCCVGNGKALLSGIHIEMSASFLSKSDPHLKGKLEKISDSEKERFLICETALQKLLEEKNSSPLYPAKHLIRSPCI